MNIKLDSTEDNEPLIIEYIDKEVTSTILIKQGKKEIGYYDAVLLGNICDMIGHAAEKNKTRQITEQEWTIKTNSMGGF